jgi:hypothetical protein
MKYITNRFGLKTLAAAVLGICVVAPVAQGRDRDRDDHVGVGVRADDRGDFGLHLSFGERDHHERRDRVERVWVDAVWRNDGGRVWVDPVWEKAVSRVWVPPVTKDVCEKVWVEPVYEDRQTITWDRGRRISVHVRVKVADGHYEERHSTVVVCDGHWDTSEKWVLKCDGHWETRDNWVCVSEGHYEDRIFRPAPVVQERRVDIHFGDR